MNYSKLIEKAVNDASYNTKSGIIDLNNEYDLFLVIEELEKHFPKELIHKALFEAVSQKPEDYKNIGGKGYVLKKDLPKDWELGKPVPDKAQRFTKGEDGKFKEQDKDDKKEKPQSTDKSDFLNNTSKEGEPPTDQELEQLGNHEKDYQEKPTNEKAVRKAPNSTAFKKVQEEIDGMPEGSQKENAQELMRLLNDYANAKNPEERMGIIRTMVDKGLIQRNAPGTSTVKFYVDPKTGLNYKAFGENTSIHQSICAYDKKYRAENDNQPLIPELREGNMGNKKVHPGGIFGKDGVTNVKIEKREDGKVVMDGVEYEKQPHPDNDPTFKRKLEESKKYLFREIHGKGTPEYKNAVKAIERHNAILDKIEDVLVEGGELEIFNPFHPEEHVAPDTPENRKKIRDKTGQKVISKLEAEIKAMGKKISPEHEAIFDKIRSLEGLSGAEYEKAVEEALTMLNKHPDTSRGLSDLCETFSYMTALGNDKAAYLPSAGNFPLGDVLAASTTKIDPEKDSPEDIANKIQLITTSVENRSVKKGGGAPSSSHKKNSLTKFKDGKDANGNPLSADQIAQDTQDMADDNYVRIFGGDLDEAESKNKEYAERYGLDLEDPDYVARKNKSVAAAMGQINGKRLKAGEEPLEVGSPEYKEQIRILEAYYDNGKIYQKAYNENFEVQYFTNDDYVIDKNGAVSRDSTDGICTVSEVKFEFNVGFSKKGTPGNKVPTRFHNVNRCEV